ncbi:hypothetical protein [Halobaculum magnesiiphilum]|uniref:Uncharacterized protein n=1 Tax=Halobaculum magnesiiphilum TaxID=1017351 RepID=A0A8T8WDZ5_9EURY|nr:hypothetical protein [Halobaculum magnesiiphilum]QZP37954.1 hypothetical protein K6T50_01930 [Halobaculum magnesiiphilum]
MNPLQGGAPEPNVLALTVWAVGHFLACLVAAAVADGAAGRRLRPARAIAGAVALAIAIPIAAAGALRLDLLDPVSALAGRGGFGPPLAMASALGVAAVVVASAAADADLTDPGYPSVAAAVRAQLSGDDFTGIVVATVALLSGEFATLTVVNWL